MQIDRTDYQRVHARRSNLLIHRVAVPLFVAAVVFVMVAASRGDPASVLLGAVFGVVAMALQGPGQKLEGEVPMPLTGPPDFMRRWFAERFVIFPLFVLCGRRWRQFRRYGRIADYES